MTTCVGVMLLFLITAGGIYSYIKVVKFGQEIDSITKDMQADIKKKPSPEGNNS